MDSGEVRENLAWAQRVMAARDENPTLVLLLASALADTSRALLAARNLKETIPPSKKALRARAARQHR